MKNRLFKTQLAYLGVVLTTTLMSGTTYAASPSVSGLKAVATPNGAVVVYSGLANSSGASASYNYKVTGSITSSGPCTVQPPISSPATMTCAQFSQSGLSYMVNTVGIPGNPSIGTLQAACNGKWGQASSYSSPTSNGTTQSIIVNPGGGYNAATTYATQLTLSCQCSAGLVAKNGQCVK